MKIYPPILNIPPDNPYVNDQFNRKSLAESLFLLIKNTDDGIVLSIDAPWGEGKTSFAKMWTADLENQKIKCIYYDAPDGHFKIPHPWPGQNPPPRVGRTGVI